jgi:hypothetical protein
MSDPKSTPQTISDLKPTPENFGRVQQNFEALFKQTSQLVSIA